MIPRLSDDDYAFLEKYKINLSNVQLDTFIGHYYSDDSCFVELEIIILL